MDPIDAPELDQLGGVIPPAAEPEQVRNDAGAPTLDEDDLNEFLASLDDGGDGSDTGEGADAATDSGDAGTSTPAPTTASDDDVLPPHLTRFGDRIMPRSEVDMLVALNDRLKADPEVATRVLQAVAPDAATTPPAAQTPPSAPSDELPEWVDPMDEGQVRLYREHQATQAKLAEIEANQARTQAQAAYLQEQQRITTIATSFEQAVSGFRQANPHVSPEDLRAIAAEAARLGLLDKAEHAGGNLAEAMGTALEMTAWGDGRFRKVMLDGSQQKDPTARKRKQAALSGAGRAAADESAPKASTPRDQVIARMTDYINAQTGLN